MPVVSRVTFTEENDARATYVFALAVVLVLLVDQVLLHSVGSHTRALYVAAVLISLIAAVSGINNLLGCIVHPIPKELRANDQLTTLHLNESPQEASSAPALMFSSLEDQVSADDEETVDGSQVELRDPIQWSKMALILACIGIDFLLLIKWGH
jgi:hypothetical protein